MSHQRGWIAGASSAEKADGVGRAVALLEGAYEAVSGLQEPETDAEIGSSTRKLHHKADSA